MTSNGLVEWVDNWMTPRQKILAAALMLGAALWSPAQTVLAKSAQLEETRKDVVDLKVIAESNSKILKRLVSLHDASKAAHLNTLKLCRQGTIDSSREPGRAICATAELELAGDVQD